LHIEYVDCIIFAELGEPHRRLACFDVGQHDVDLSITLSLSLSFSLHPSLPVFICVHTLCMQQACSAGLFCILSLILILFPAFSRFLYFQYFSSTTVGYLLTRVCFSRTKSI
ncbi:hypothetical protein T08_9778, partial [Trichinella sp. T8]